MRSMMNGLQSLGRALMLPIAVMPVAGLLLRLGQPDLLDIAFLSAAGDTIFAHLGLLFAVGVAGAYARDGNIAAALAGVVCFLVTRGGAVSLMQAPADVTAGQATALAEVLTAAWKDKAIARIEVPIGILSGVAGGLIYNRVVDIRVPSYLAFFGGSRMAPIASGLAGLLLAALIGAGFASVTAAVDALSRAIAYSGPAGMFLYGLLNRLLLVTGLHHILNNIAWFVAGDYHGASGDLRRFFAGDPAAGAFMSGFFPVMMFGLPAACLAMYRTALPSRRKEVGGLLFSIGLTSALTGVTEPIEFTFMFVAPILYAIHALLTGVAMASMNLLGVHLGFTFSAGLFDYALNFGRATRPLLLLPFGMAYAAIYYLVFRHAILRFDLATPGRDAEAEAAADAPRPSGPRGEAFVAALGGAANLTSIGACTTRLRLTLADSARVDEARLKALGAVAVLRPSATAMQVVLGPIADTVATEMRGASRTAPDAEPASRDRETATLSADLIGSLGGAGNIVRCDMFRRRIRVAVLDEALFDHAALDALGLRHIERVGGQWHLLFAAHRADPNG